MSDRSRSEAPPFVIGATGLFFGAVTMHTAWSLTFRICDWHHGLAMLAVGFAVAGYGVGVWAAQRARDERDAALERARLADERYEALDAVLVQLGKRDNKGERS